MLQIFENYGDIIFSLLFSVVSVVCFFVTFLRTGSVKKSLCEVRELIKFKTSLTEQAPKAQEFTSEVKDYVLNPVTNELEELEIPKNVQEYIQSFVNVALDRALERFMPKDVQESDVVCDYAQASTDLSVLAESLEVAEAYREKLGLPDTYSIAQIYEAVDVEAKRLKGEIDKIHKKESDINGKNEET